MEIDQMSCMLRISEFCHEHALSRAMFYKLLGQGKGPKVAKIGRRTFVSQESAQAWRRRMERETALSRKENA
jgi:predicted DNA-binding transcriptional regulator AlpA